jgi:hypothetical protein
MNKKLLLSISLTLVITIGTFVNINAAESAFSITTNYVWKSDVNGRTKIDNLKTACVRWLTSEAGSHK